MHATLQPIVESHSQSSPSIPSDVVTRSVQLREFDLVAVPLQFLGLNQRLPLDQQVGYGYHIGPFILSGEARDSHGKVTQLLN